MAPSAPITVPVDAIDLAMLRAQKLGLVVLAKRYPWLWGVVSFFDDFQDRLAEAIGEEAVFGPVDEAGELVGAGICRLCGVPVALDERREEPTWVDATGGRVCPARAKGGAGDDGRRGHEPDQEEPDPDCFFCREPAGPDYHLARDGEVVCPLCWDERMR